MEWKGFSPGIAPTRRPSSRLWRPHSFVCNAVCSSRPDRLRCIGRTADGHGVLLSSDTLYVTTDRQHVTFMRSFPNWIPLGASGAAQVVTAVERWPFDRVYGVLPGLVIRTDAKTCLRRSLDRHRRAIAEGRPSLT